jgi:hypothetical protein
LAYEAEEYPAMNESTTGIDIVPPPTGQDVLTEVLRDGARRMLARLLGWHHSTVWRKRNGKSPITESDRAGYPEGCGVAESQ